MKEEILKKGERNSVYIKTFQSSDKTLVAICDKEVLGKIFRSGEFRLDVKESFYKGILSNMPDALDILNKVDIANLTGKKIVHAAVRGGYADSRAIIYIGGVPHLQIMKL